MKTLHGKNKAKKNKVATAKMTIRGDLQDGLKNFVSDKSKPGRINNMIIRSIQTNQMIKQSIDFRKKYYMESLNRKWTGSNIHLEKYL